MMQSLQFLLVVLWVAVCSGAEGGALEDYVSTLRRVSLGRRWRRRTPTDSGSRTWH